MSDFTINLDDLTEQQNLKERQIYLDTILKTLHEVSMLICEDLNKDNFLNSLPSILVKPAGFKMAWIILSGRDHTGLSSHFAGEPGYPDIYESFLSENNLPPCLVAIKGRSGCQPIDPFPAFNPNKSDQEELSGYAYPLRIKKNTTGFLVVVFEKRYLNDEQHRQLFEEIAIDVITTLHHDQTLMRLRESEEKFRVLFERSADAQLIMKGDLFIECNDAMMRLLGAQKKEDLIGVTPWEVSPEFQPDGMSSRIKASSLIKVAESGQSNRFEWIHTLMDGTDVPVEVSLTPVNYGSESFVHVAMRDISDRRKAEKELRSANRLFQLIMANTPDIIWMRDLDFHLTYINEAVERIKGFTPEEAMGRKLRENVTPENFEFFKKTLSEELAMESRPDSDPGRVRRFETDEVCKDGSVIHAETLTAFLRDEKGNPMGMLGITRDITEQQELFLKLAEAKEKAEESDRLKSSFLANMSHEIRTPMNSILGFAELLGADDIDPDERRQYVRIIQAGTNQLLSIISDIIDISKIEAGQVLLNPEPVNLNQLFEQLQTSFGLEMSRMGKENVKLIRSCTCHELEKDVVADAFRLNQVMGNLISNAIKFTETGSIEFGCTYDEHFFRFFVRDTGKGISPDHQAIIFERFRQVEETLTRNYTGTGLGLAICNGLVSLMGGKIGVISEPGKGSEFWFTVPVMG